MSEQSVMVITGTSRGIGKGLAEFFLNKGYIVAGCSRGASNISHPNYTHSELDLTDEIQVQKWARKLRTDLKKVDSLICNVGLVKSALFMTMTPGAVFDSFLKTNLSATFFVCREISKIMLSNNYGRIVNIASILTEIHEPGTSAYSMTKSGVIEFTKCIARELAPNHITCNVVSPSVVQTEAVDDLGEDWKERALALQTIKRVVNFDEVANVVSFFVSRESSAITGQVINMCLVN
ncbi:3-oxoacyl-(Acyl-carrier-protein) reductase [Leptospira ryugenii]|uniref:3-oxoacyl-(Acyl-carrier-protein) reductase n=1 Tax=Leptospira ryugenii TaxID=1917863 RepID=A0A2P2DW27_9LEPT|nr:SDR family oxidoreductase [Leptospira ryugenii]GBF48841.1 3-oxoacyl-(Acyl-carrier-protein) reductase [Leptospira ryugenii]